MKSHYVSSFISNKKSPMVNSRQISTGSIEIDHSFIMLFLGPALCRTEIIPSSLGVSRSIIIEGGHSEGRASSLDLMTRGQRMMTSSLFFGCYLGRGA